MLPSRSHSKHILQEGVAWRWRARVRSLRHSTSNRRCRLRLTTPPLGPPPRLAVPARLPGWQEFQNLAVKPPKQPTTQRREQRSRAAEPGPTMTTAAMSSTTLPQLRAPGASASAKGQPPNLRMTWAARIKKARHDQLRPAASHPQASRTTEMPAQRRPRLPMRESMPVPSATIPPRRSHLCG